MEERWESMPEIAGGMHPVEKQRWHGNNFSVGEQPVHHCLQKRLPAANRSQGQQTMLKQRIRMRQQCCPYFPGREGTNPGTWFCTLKRSFLVIFSIFSIFYKLQHIQHIFHIVHILHPHILHILQGFITSQWWMDGRSTCLVRRAPMLALPQCLPVQLDQHRLTVTLDRAAAALMLLLPACCGISVDGKNTLKLLLTTLSSLSLALHCRLGNWPLGWPICFNMQNMQENMQENMLNMTQYAEYDKKDAEQYAKYDKKYV
jgi:hypothetical protein